MQYHKVGRMEGLLFICIISRFVLIFLAVIANIVFQDHDAEGVEQTDYNESSMLAVAMSTFSKWDSVYYLDISHEWYQQDTHYVFYPLYPSCIKLLGHFVQAIAGVTERNAHIIAAVTISNASFVIAFLALRRTFTAWHCSKLNVNNILFLFICTPANIFFVTAYTESLFAMLAWMGMFCIQTNHDLLGGLLLFMASLTRSNGVFNVVFVLVVLLQRLVRIRDWSQDLPRVCSAAIVCVSVCLPYVLFSHYAFDRLCFPDTVVVGGAAQMWEDQALGTGGGTCSLMGGGLIDCSSISRRDRLFGWDLAFMGIYPSLQLAHWNVGFLSQFCFRQIPNILLALPVLSISAHTLWRSCSWTPRNDEKSAFLCVISPEFPHLCHLACLTAVCVCFAHVQVSTRVLLSACPILYRSLGEHAFSGNAPSRKYVWSFIIAFNLAGVLAHPNFYPWT